MTSFILRRSPLVLKIFQIVFSSEVVRVLVLPTLSLDHSFFSCFGMSLSEYLSDLVFGCLQAVGAFYELDNF